MFSREEVLKIHEILINEFGGAHGVRDLDLLDSALNRPFQTFDGKDLYEKPEQKAAAILESLLINHPFIDGNKRIGYTLMRVMLLNYESDIEATENEKYEFVISITEGKMDIEQIAEWILLHKK